MQQLADQPDQSQDLTQEGPSNQGEVQQLPLGDNIVQMPAGNNRRLRECPDLEDVVTQQTELLAAMLNRLNQQPAQPAAQVNPDETPCGPCLPVGQAVHATGNQLPGARRLSSTADGHLAVLQDPNAHG